jgi:DNA polymerase/3'-5' exonuclease PolX
MSGKTKFPRAVAIEAAKAICDLIKPATEEAQDGARFLKVCGSLRRRKSEVGDVEIVYVPQVTSRALPNDLLGVSAGEVQMSLVDEVLEGMIQAGILAPRLNKLGRQTWGPENKLAVHVPTGVSVDFFSTSRVAWWGYIVCRTGSAETNTRIASEARRKGWRWHPTAGHFTDVMGRKVLITSEEDVFHLVGLPYLEPWER